MSLQIGDYTLVNDEKIDRAVNGSMTRGGMLTGGVGRNADEDVLLSKYDELGGLIMKGKLKVKTGSFFDFKEKKTRLEPKVLFEMSMNGRVMVVDESKASALQLAKDELAEAEKTASQNENDDDDSQIKPKKRKVGSKKKDSDEDSAE